MENFILKQREIIDFDVKQPQILGETGKKEKLGYHIRFVRQERKISSGLDEALYSRLRNLRLFLLGK